MRIRNWYTEESGHSRRHWVWRSIVDVVLGLKLPIVLAAGCASGLCARRRHVCILISSEVTSSIPVGANIIQIGFTALTGYVTLYEAHTYHDRALDVPIESQKQLKNGKY